VTERIASPEADWNHASEMMGSNAACKENFGGQEDSMKKIKLRAAAFYLLTQRPNG
jgi:hypothetical protein